MNLCKGYCPFIKGSSHLYREKKHWSIVPNRLGYVKYKIDDDVNLGVMLFSGQVTTNKKFDPQKLEYLFPLDSKSSRINFVRIATYLDGLDVSYEIAVELVKKGFDVSINLMQIQNADEKVLKDFGETSKKIKL